ncbi:MAG TPA: T9SS type A sorting domain-containing protein [Cytophagaceae bacterium]|jgi:hypothetical protein
MQIKSLPNHYLLYSIIFLFSLLFIPKTIAQVVNGTTGKATTWSAPLTWTNGVPTTGANVLVNHFLSIDQNIRVEGGNYIINKRISGKANKPYSLTIDKSGNMQGIFLLNASAYFYGDLVVKNGGILRISDGDTLVVGSALFENNSKIEVAPKGVLIVNGNVTNENNSNMIMINGKLTINGSFVGGNGAAIIGRGLVTTTGSAMNEGTSTIFESNSDCLTGPCSYSPTITSVVEIASENDFISDVYVFDLIGNSIFVSNDQMKKNEVREKISGRAGLYLLRYTLNNKVVTEKILK